MKRWMLTMKSGIKNCVVVKIGLKKYPSAALKQLFVCGCTISRHVAGVNASLKNLLKTLILYERSSCHTHGSQLYSHFTRQRLTIGSPHKTYTHKLDPWSIEPTKYKWIINQTVDSKSLDSKQTNRTANAWKHFYFFKVD